MITDAERIAGLERQLAEVIARLATSQEQTTRALDNTDRAIAQAEQAIELAQTFRKEYEELKRK